MFYPYNLRCQGCIPLRNNPMALAAAKPPRTDPQRSQQYSNGCAQDLRGLVVDPLPLIPKGRGFIFLSFRRHRNHRSLPSKRVSDQRAARRADLLNTHVNQLVALRTYLQAV